MYSLIGTSTTMLRNSFALLKGGSAPSSFSFLLICHFSIPSFEFSFTNSAASVGPHNLSVK